MIKTQKGFAALEVLLILVIVAIIGGTGWYVLSSKNDIYQNYDSANSSSAPKASARSKLKGKGELANSKISFSYDDSLWTLLPNSSDTACGQSVLSDAKCKDHSYLVLKSEGSVNSDQFQVSIGVFDANGYTSAKDWYLKYLDASEGGEPNGYPSKTSGSAINGSNAYFEQSDYGTDESRLGWGVLGKTEGVLVRVVLFKGDHYSFKTSNDYFKYRADVEAIVNSLKITD